LCVSRLGLPPAGGIVKISNRESLLDRSDPVYAINPFRPG
jgi:hypothetical protein